MRVERVVGLWLERSSIGLSVEKPGGPEDAPCKGPHERGLRRQHVVLTVQAAASRSQIQWVL